MDRDTLTNSLQDDYNKEDLNSLDESNICERNESLIGLTRSKLCENCENYKKLTPLGQSVRRCQACARRKNMLDKRNTHEELEIEEKVEIDQDVKEDQPVITTSRFVTEVNTRLEETWSDSARDSHNEYFDVEHEHVDFHSANVLRASNVTNNDDGKGVPKKREITLITRRDYKALNASELTTKKEKCGYPKGRYVSNKDNVVINDKKEQPIELDGQKTKEELELERRERGWILNGSIIGKNALHSKVSPMKIVVPLDGSSPGYEQKDQIKVKNLKEKADTQRILGLVARRSESRLNSPTHRAPNYKKNEEPHIPSIILHEKKPEISKSLQARLEMETSSIDGSNCGENKHEQLNPNAQEMVATQLPIPTEYLKPSLSSHSPNENLISRTHNILELLAKRNGSRVSSPKKSYDHNRLETEPNTKTYDNPIQLNQPREGEVLFCSTKLSDERNPSCSMRGVLSCTSTSASDKSDFVHNDNHDKQEDSIVNKSSGAQTYKAEKDLEPSYVASTKVDVNTNDIHKQLHNTSHILGLIAQRSASPKKSMFDNTPSKKNESLYNSKENGYLRPTTVNVTNENVMSNGKNITSSSKEIEENTPKVTNSTSTLLSDNILFEKTKDTKKSYEDVESRSNSPDLKFPAPQSRICHVNDNPLYGTRCENEPRSCVSNNINRNHSRSSCSSTSLLVVPNTIGKSLRSTPTEGFETNTKEPCSNLLVRNSSIYNSSNAPPIFKSALATPTCKSPEPTNEIYKKTYFVNECRHHAKEVEIVQEEQKPTPKIERFEELHTKTHSNNDKSCGKINGNTLEILHAMNSLGSTKNILNEDSCKSKIKFDHDTKVSPSKSILQSQCIWWPIKTIFGVITYPFRLVFRFILLILNMFSSTIFGICRVLKMCKNTLFMGVVYMRSNILESIQNKCTSSQRLSQCGCASKTYFLVVITSLILPSLLDLDFYLVNRFIEGQVVIQEPLNFDFTKEHPIASVNLLPQNVMSRAKGYFSDKEVMTTHAFPPSYAYHMIVHLTLPESQYNQDIGMFQIIIETFSTRGHSLCKASRASMLRYYSPLVKYMKSVVMGIPIVLGLYQESQKLSIQLIDGEEEKEHSPTASVTIKIEPKVGHLNGLGVPEIYHGELQVIAHNPYMREIARKWVWNLYVYGGLAFLCLEVLLFMCCCRRIFPKKGGSKKKFEEFLSEDKKIIPEKEQKNIHSPRRLHKEHTHYFKSLPLALPSNISSSSDKTIEK